MKAWISPMNTSNSFQMMSAPRGCRPAASRSADHDHAGEDLPKSRSASVNGLTISSIMLIGTEHRAFGRSGRSSPRGVLRMPAMCTRSRTRPGRGQVDVGRRRRQVFGVVAAGDHRDPVGRQDEEKQRHRRAAPRTAATRCPASLDLLFTRRRWSRRTAAANTSRQALRIGP